MIRAENLEREFYKDVREKKSLVPSSRHKKRGSKTKFVSLPHDNMTERAWRAMNGEVKNYNLKKPMGWQDFKELSPDLMEEYLAFLTEEFSATGANIARELGITYGTLFKLLKSYSLDGIFKRGAKQPKKKIEAMHRFFCPDEVPETDETPVERVTQEVEPVAEANPGNLGESRNPIVLPVSESIVSPPLFESNLTKFTFDFNGQYKEKDLMNTMRLMVGEGTTCRITVIVSKEG